MRGFVAGLALALLVVVPVFAVGGLSATIALDQTPPVSGDVTYSVTVHDARNPYVLWVGQRCYLAGELVDAQYQGVQWTSVTQAKGNKSDGVGFAGPFETSGIHRGSGTEPGEVIETPWSSDQCEAWVWVYPDLDPIASTAFAVGP